MTEPYRKDLSHITWDEVFARQVRRAGLVEDWMDALQLQPGARALDIGAPARATSAWFWQIV